MSDKLNVTQNRSVKVKDFLHTVKVKDSLYTAKVKDSLHTAARFVFALLDFASL